MSPERWQKIEEIFHSALERSADERAAYLDQACAGDDSLRQEVELLLTADSQKESSIEALPSVVAAGWMAKRQRKSLIGTVIAHYRITSMLGSGGMGEVYLAEDTSLGRKVALKFLPHHFTEEPERVRRFEQEARAASALNHPNIITIYEIGQWNGVSFIATEFIEGQTLRERMQHHQLPSTEALEIGVQVANALAAAHAAGIVHRDIKPANVMVRGDGYVKVLDFGLAKLTSPVSAASAEHADAKTDPGRVMGTINYMSPEQALGQPIDHRTDIFSLGVVLYEMATGKLPFAGNSDAAVYDALLNRAPEPITVSNPELPIELEAIIKRALAKNREARYQTASDLRADLKRLQRESDSDHPAVVRPAAISLRARLLFATVILLVAAVGIYLLSVRLRQRRPEQAVAPLAISQHISFTQQTDQPGTEYFPTLSPDGQTLIYASHESGNWDLWRQTVGKRERVNLTKDSPDDDTQPEFSPDGKQIAFRSERAGGGLFVMDLASRDVRKIIGEGFNPTWSADGAEIAYGTASVTFVEGRANSQLWAVQVTTGKKRFLTDRDAVQPAWSPHGQRIAFWSERADLWTISANGGTPVRVTHNQTIDWNPCWSADGKYLYFTSDRGGSVNLWRIAIDETSGEVLGAAEPATTPATDMLHLAIARDGHHTAYVQRTKQRRLQALPFDPVTGTVRDTPISITRGTGAATHPSVSPDGQWLAYSSAGGPQEDIYVIRTDGSGLRQLTNDAARDRVPRWSPDGKRIAFYSDRDGKNEIWAVATGGSGALEQLTFAGGRAVYPTWSPDGNHLAYYHFGIGSYIIDLRKPWQQQTPQPIGRGQSEPDLAIWNWSPDGTKLACIKFRPGTEQMSVAIYEFGAQDAAPQLKTIVENADNAVWLNDSRRLLFTLAGKICVTDPQANMARELFAPAANEAAEYCTLSPDNRTIYYSLATTEADIWLATF